MAVLHYRRGSRVDPSAVSGLRRRDPSERTARRIYLFAFVALVWLLAVVVRMGDMQIRQGSRFTAKALRQQEGTIEVGASRGVIYDRFGEELALSTPVDSIGVFPDKVQDPAFTSTMLRQVLDIDRGDLDRKLRGSEFDWVKRFAEPGEAMRVRHLNLTAIHFEKESKRYYPKGTVAAHILGSVGTDHFGLAGLEQQFEERLRGTPGKNLVQYDALRNHYASRILQEPVPGSDLVLTLDQRIQMLAERELRRAVEETSAQAGTIVIMDPHSGDLLAMASWPPFDPHVRPQSKADMKSWRNYAISNLIEPGSTFKLVTLAAVLEEGLATPNEVLDCENGAFYLGRRLIRDHKPFGMLTVSEIVANSSNIGAVKLALRLREPRFYEYIRRFGFGEPTGLPLPNELEGLLRPVSQWQSTSLASIAFGQEIGVTAVQMARATAAIANGGMLVEPRIVDAIVAPDGHRERYASGPPRRMITAKTAATLRAMMEKTVQDGTARMAHVPGYRVAGKTGTAQKADPATRGYSDSDYIANFVGFAPVNDPSIVVVIAVDSPEGEHHGGQIAAPIFPHLAAQALRFRDVRPDLPVDPRKRPSKTVPPELLADYVNQRWVEEALLASRRESSGDAIVVAAMGGALPAAAAGRGGQAPDELAADPGRQASNGGQKVVLQVTDRLVPDFRGRTVRDVVAESASLGLRLDIQGRGVALRQWPAAGMPVPPGARVRVAFGRHSQGVSAGP
jgi:cell division protein FtsI (penicillin-binding protein 3)